jgi:hypothetical protein
MPRLYEVEMVLWGKASSVTLRLLKSPPRSAAA